MASNKRRVLIEARKFVDLDPFCDPRDRAHQHGELQNAVRAADTHRSFWPALALALLAWAGVLGVAWVVRGVGG